MIFNKILHSILAICPNAGRKICKIFNIKFNYRNTLYLSKYLEAKSQNKDITKFPPADGLLRELQLSILSILKEFDYVCRKNNIEYWLAYGTQLGATRHKGFIPWDDDLDVAILRDDYEKIAEIFNQNTRNKDLYIEIVKNNHTPCMLIMKIKHKKLPFLFVDIFPWDLYYKPLSEQERAELNSKLIDLRNKLNTDKPLLKLSKKDIYDFATNLRIKKILENHTVDYNSKPDIFMGLDFPHASKNRVFNYNDVFPIQDVDFEGLKLKQMNNPIIGLESTFGKNYMDYPNGMTLGHINGQVISNKERKIMREFIDLSL